MNPLNQWEAAYLAGLIDGEGCITAWAPKKRGGGYGITLKVTIAMRTPESIAYVHERTGIGKLYIQHKKTQNNAVYYVWDVFARQETHDLITTVLPYLHTKKAQAELFLKLRALVKKGSRSEELMQTKLSMVTELRELKRMPS